MQRIAHEVPEHEGRIGGDRRGQEPLEGPQRLHQPPEGLLAHRREAAQERLFTCVRGTSARASSAAGRAA